MSKPIVRVVFAVLISLVIIAAAAASPVVQSEFGSVFRKTGANTAANTSMFADNQTLEQLPASSQFDEFAPSDSSRHCNSDSTSDY